MRAGRESDQGVFSPEGPGSKHANLVNKSSGGKARFHHSYQRPDGKIDYNRKPLDDEEINFRHLTYLGFIKDGSHVSTDANGIELFHFDHDTEGYTFVRALGFGNHLRVYRRNSG